MIALEINLWSQWARETSVVARSLFGRVFLFPGFEWKKEDSGYKHRHSPFINLQNREILYSRFHFLKVFKKSNIIPEARQFWSLPSFSFLSFCFSKNSLEKFVLLRQEYWIFLCYSTRIQISSILSLFCISLHQLHPTHCTLHFSLLNRLRVSEWRVELVIHEACR